MRLEKKGETSSFSTIIAVIGAILIAVGFAWLVAWNWHVMPDIMKILILVVATALALVVGVMLRTHDYKKIGESLILLGALLYSLSVFLIAQIYHINATAQSTSFLFLICLVGAATFAFAFKSNMAGLVGCAAFLSWIATQTVAFFDISSFAYSSEGRTAILMLFAIFGAVAGLTTASSLLHSRMMGIGAIIAGVILVIIVGSFIPFASILTYPALIIGGIVWFFRSKKKKSTKPEAKEVEELDLKEDIYPIVSLVVQIAILWFILYFVSSIGIQAAAFIVLIFLAINAVLSYALESNLLVVLSIAQLLYWIVVQIAAFKENNPYSGLAILIYLVADVLLFGLMLLHKSSNHSFKNIYRSFAVFGALLFSFVFTFQEFLPHLWPKGVGIGSNTLIFVIVLAALAVLTLVIGLITALNSRAIDGKYALVCLMFLIFFIVLLFSSIAVGTDNSYSYDYGFRNYGTISLGLWFLWIFSNIVFILFILALIGEGTRQNSKSLVNLGIAAFIIDILSRYIGFIRDLWGYTSMAIIFIVGGITLLIGGWLVEKWRRSLTQKIGQGPQQEANTRS